MLLHLVRLLMVAALCWAGSDAKQLNSVGERVLNKSQTQYEVTLIMQGDLLIKRQCECMKHAKCGMRNFIKLYGTSCPRPDHVCCIIIEPHTLPTAIDYDNTHLTTSPSPHRKSPVVSSSTRTSP